MASQSLKPTHWHSANLGQCLSRRTHKTHEPPDSDVWLTEWRLFAWFDGLRGRAVNYEFLLRSRSGRVTTSS